MAMPRRQMAKRLRERIGKITPMVPPPSFALYILLQLRRQRHSCPAPLPQWTPSQTQRHGRRRENRFRFGGFQHAGNHNFRKVIPPGG